MLKAIVSYSKKVPAETEYSSQGYSLSLETEIPENEPGKIQDRLHQTFELVKTAVEHELANGNGRPSKSATPGTNTVPAQRANGKATNRQIKFVTDLATRQGIALNDLNARIRDQFGVDGLYDLDKKQASQILDDLKLAKAA